MDKPLMPFKAYCETEVKSLEEETRSLQFVISTNKVDRSRDSISPDGWDLESYKKNPVVLWAHDAATPPIAKASEIAVVEGKLRSAVEFVPKDNLAIGSFAEGIYQMYKGGFLSATSVGFMPLEMAYSDVPERKGGLDFIKQELMEFSLVPVPANSDALLEGKAVLGVDIVRPVFDTMVKMVSRYAAVEAMLEIRQCLDAGDLRAFGELILEVSKDEPPLPKPDSESAQTKDKEIARRAYMRRKRQLDVIKIRGNH